MAVPFDQPVPVVLRDELTNRLPHLVQRLEVVQVQTFLLRRLHEAFDDAVDLIPK